ncbi:uncharacterized protein LOC62_03G004528 [Vanrija pseudolonga]|uniref:Uncharacterized protein n=1 Tax=Vanrija pseudolonga TaxID=143232 RepID=A0AAF1BKF3_9TREE|nr:hypothetical protein LOC62_03G004528 [Vanrija pseudolonga]
MGTTLLVHPTSLSLLTLRRASASSGSGASASPTFRTVQSSTPLALPSRFPASATPHAAVRPNGHVYVYARSAPVVWEYDARGRRIGEISAREGVEHVAAFAGGVVVSSGSELRVWRRVNGKWAPTGTLDAPAGITALVGGGDAVVVLGEEVVAFDSDGRRTVLEGIEVPVTAARVLADPASLVVPSADGVALVALKTGEHASAQVNCAVAHLASSGKRLALAAEGARGEVAVLNVDELATAPTTLSFGHEVAGLVFVDSDILAARTATGRLFIVDLAGPSLRPTEVALEHPVLDAVSLPPVEAPRRARSTPSLARNVLAESKATNVPSSPVSRGFDDKKERGVEEKRGERTVSAPVRQAAAALPRPSTRAVSIATPTSGPVPTRQPSSARLRASAAVEPIEEESISPRSRRGSTPPEDRDAPPTWEAYDEMRREIANLQLDVLRMGRNLKNEIRSAISPLVDELRASREVIAKQQAEIERLRRGY